MIDPAVFNRPEHEPAFDTGFPGSSCPMFSSPRAVLADRGLSTEEKRQVLSGWASDAWAPASQPTLRWPPGAEAPVPVAQILSALVELDGGVGSPGN